MVIIVRDTKTGKILQTSRDTTSKDIAESNKKRKASGKSVGDSTTAITTPTDTGGSVTITRSGKVTERDSSGRIIDSFQGSSTAVNEYINQEVADRSSRSISKPSEVQTIDTESGTKALIGGERTGLYYELGSGGIETIGEIKKDILEKKGNTFEKTGFELTPEGIQSLKEQRYKPTTQYKTIEQQERDERSRLDKEAIANTPTTYADLGKNLSNNLVLEPARSTKTERAVSYLKQNIIGNPFGAFFSPYQDFSDAFLNPSGTRYNTNKYLVGGDGRLPTPVEQYAAVFGTISLLGTFKQAAGLGTAETKILTSVPKFLKFPTGLGLSGIEAYSLGKLTNAIEKSNAPENIKPYLLTNNDAYRNARAAEKAAEKNIIWQGLGGLNSNFNKRQIDTFEKQLAIELQEKGLTGEAYDLAYKAGLYRREYTQSFGELATTLNAGRFSEVYGFSNFEKAGQITGNFGQRFYQGFKNIFPAGVIETQGELRGDRARIGSSLPVIDTKNIIGNFVPTFSKETKQFTFKTQLAEDIGYGTFGGLTAGIIGGFVTAGATAPKGLKGQGSRSTGKIAEITGNILDLSEIPTDILAGTGRNIPIITFTPSFTATPTKTSTAATNKPFNFIDTSLSQAFSFTPSQAPVVVPSLVNTDIFVDTSVKSSSRTTTGVPSIVPSIVPADIPAEVPVNVFASVPSNVPVLSSVWRLPPPLLLPLDFPAGSGLGGSARAGMKAYVNELKQGKVLLGNLLGNSNNKPLNKLKTTKKKVKKKKTLNKQMIGGQRQQFKLPFNII